MQQDLKRCTRCKSEKQEILVDHTKDSNTGLKVAWEAGHLVGVERVKLTISSVRRPAGSYSRYRLIRFLLQNDLGPSA